MTDAHAPRPARGPGARLAAADLRAAVEVGVVAGAVSTESRGTQAALPSLATALERADERRWHPLPGSTGAELTGVCGPDARPRQRAISVRRTRHDRGK